MSSEQGSAEPLVEENPCLRLCPRVCAAKVLSMAVVAETALIPSAAHLRAARLGTALYAAAAVEVAKFCGKGPNETGGCSMDGTFEQLGPAFTAGTQMGSEYNTLKTRQE